jgi:L-amino acid N-acyltransferase YncA
MEIVKKNDLCLQKMQAQHYAAVKEIYELGIATQNATLETQAPDWGDWDKKHLPECRIVALNGNNVIGWGALSPVSGRCVYKGVAEDSVYIHPAYAGKGVGILLLSELIRCSEQAGIWTLQAHILVENIVSRKLHSKCGFREVGIRKGLGQLHGKWRDTCLMERRSKVVGV